MPYEHREIYTSTTLLIVIGTTIICGSLTEPMLSSMGMRLEKNPAPSRGGSATGGTPPSSSSSSSSSNGSTASSSSDGATRSITGLFNRTGSRGQAVEMTTPDRSAYEVSFSPPLRLPACRARPLVDPELICAFSRFASMSIPPISRIAARIP